MQDTGLTAHDVRRMSLEERLLSRREISPSGCWEWTGSYSGITPPRYGTLGWNGRYYKVHRLAAHLWKGFDLSSPLVVCHDCDNSKCFNPDHLTIATQKFNVDEMFKRGRASFPPVPRKLNEHQVRRIHLMNQCGTGVNQIAPLFKVWPNTIVGIVKRKTWKHVV